MPRRKTALESKYQHELIGRIEDLLPGCLVMKQDSTYRQGILDLVIFYGPRWAMLEVKARETLPGSPDFEPNQEWYIDWANEMSFGACIYPENEREVLSALQRSFQRRR